MESHYKDWDGYFDGYSKNVQSYIYEVLSLKRAGRSGFLECCVKFFFRLFILNFNVQITDYPEKHIKLCL